MTSGRSSIRYLLAGIGGSALTAGFDYHTLRNLLATTRPRWPLRGSEAAPHRSYRGQGIRTDRAEPAGALFLISSGCPGHRLAAGELCGIDPGPTALVLQLPGMVAAPRIRQSNAISLPGALGATRRPSTPASGDEPSSPFSAFYRAVPGPTARPAGWRVILSLCHRPPPFPYHYKCPFDLADLAMARISRHAGDDAPPKYSWL